MDYSYNLFLFRVIAKGLKLPWRQIDRFATLQKQLKCSLGEMIEHAKTFLTNDLYDLEELLALFEIKEEDFKQSLLCHNTQHLREFKLRQRGLHVLEEAQRVEKFRETAIKSTSIHTLSQLMNESHQSLDELYECSHENLNALVAIGKECGVGIRLTGAG